MLTITTFDWVPEMARGYVRDLRVRWACEEAGLAYRVDTVPSVSRTPGHLARQPFHQVPMLRDGDLSLFETGAILLHLAEKSDALMPAGRRAEVTQWVVAALNSVEMWAMPWLVARVFDHDETAAARASRPMNERLQQMDAVLEGRDWLVAGRFTAADIVMADVLRPLNDLGALADFPAAAAYVARATGRPAFGTARSAQLAHFEAARPPAGLAAS